MTSRQAVSIKLLRRKLIELFGGKCRVCGSTVRLEFAHRHKHETKLSKISRGRGRCRRVYDVMKNPQSYLLLCQDCHGGYDSDRIIIEDNSLENVKMLKSKQNNLILVKSV